MKWVVIGLFLVGLFFVLLGFLGNRYGKHQSVDVDMGNSFIQAGGFFFWVIDVLVILGWGLYRLMFT